MPQVVNGNISIITSFLFPFQPFCIESETHFWRVDFYTPWELETPWGLPSTCLKLQTCNSSCYLLFLQCWFDAYLAGPLLPKDNNTSSRKCARNGAITAIIDYVKMGTCAPIISDSDHIYLCLTTKTASHRSSLYCSHCHGLHNCKDNPSLKLA